METTRKATEEPNLHVVWEALKYLIKPTFDKQDDESKGNGLHGAFLLNRRRALEALALDCHPHRYDATQVGSDLLWDFVDTALFLLSSIKEKLRDDVISVSQQKDVCSCLQFIVSLGILPNVLPGVAHNIAVDSAMEALLKECVPTEMQKYERLCAVVNALLSFCDNSNFRPLIISNSIHFLLGGLFQLSYAPLKKPIKDFCDAPEKSGFQMSIEVWEKLQKDKQYFKTQLHQLVKETYQPKIMSELMVLQGSFEGHSPPLWLKKSISSHLTACLIQPGGVAALIRATFDSAPDTGSDWKKTETLAKIISSPVNHLNSIAAQLLSIIEGKGTRDMLPIAVACVKQLLEKDIHTCRLLILDPLLQPLNDGFSKECVVSTCGHTLISEERVDCLVKQLHPCFTMSNSKVSSVSLPGWILLPFSSFFFKLYCKVQGSASILSKQTEEILYYILVDCNEFELKRFFKCILLEEEEENMCVFPRNFGFNFGPNGGVSLDICQESSKDMFSSVIEDSGDMLMLLLEKKSDGEVLVFVFEVLLKMLVDNGMKPNTSKKATATLETFEETMANLMSSSGKHLGIVRILAALVENTNVRQKLTEKPGPILTFIVNLLNSLLEESSLIRLEDEEDLECIFVAFMVINVMLDNCDEESDWSIFADLLKPVSVIRERTKNDELKRLADRVYNIITACGAIQEKDLGIQTERQKTKCEEALHDACDPLLPVRGHALVQLAKLLQIRDRETMGQKEAVFCLFIENLKNSDSYIYLAAINGVVAYAAVQPDKAVNTLTKEYIDITSAGESSSRDPELRMKIGEILVKLVRELGGMAPMHKNELLNAFLVGAKDPDHLMRASSLSNLGEVCQILGFRVGPILRELLMCLECVLKFDKAIEPRRASVMVVTLLLRGLDASTLNVLEDAVLQLYRSLKSVYNNDGDEVVRLHAQLALEELGRLAQDLLVPKLPFEKKIHILP